ncbi:TetR/AcrR family transcriptional regulator [Allobranchiibius sp. GilTou38]|uniref:TetR/AcrR family transcriptional regulator n=1 Tax=Allobranchiibius sp. GilTou38 TaxID=2815210 RepID=UPI001AA0B62F|nr:TetR/AcrR family transcriptional regulator [Allobranchiibius sp. GilTou38]MBO1767153.1 TetR/AcrR family transcriptional regulator [Allobranchiibius sp. GilTou38]
MTSTAPLRRTGGRSARVLDAIYTAVGQLVGEGKPDRLTIPVVAERAGVNPTSIYRRWGDIDELLEEVAVAALTKDGDRAPDTGSLAGDLQAWARIVLEDIGTPKRTRYLRAMVAARDGLAPDCPCLAQRRVMATELIERTAARGERAPSVEQIIDHLVMPLYGRVLMGHPTDQSDADRLAADVLALAEREVARTTGR